jgi:hypothetical protein
MFGDMMNKLRDMKEKVEETKKQLDDKILDVKAAGGDIRIKINGNRKFISVEIADSLRFASKDEFDEQLLVALNKASAEAEKVFEDEMKRSASGLLPGIF